MHDDCMTIQSIDVANKQVVINFCDVERVVYFSDAGDVDVEPFGDLSEEEGMKLFDMILNSQEINEAFPIEDHG